MLLRSLQLEAFRGITTELAFPERAVAVVGINGSGKTSILEACSVLLGFLVSHTTQLHNPRPLGFDDETWRIDGPRDRVFVMGEFSISGHQVRLLISRAQGIDRNEIVDLDAYVAQGSAGHELRPLLAYYRTGRLWFGESQQASDEDTWEAGYRGCLDPAVNDRNWGSWLTLGSDGNARRAELLDRLFGFLGDVTGLRGVLHAAFNGEVVFGDSRHLLPLRLLPDGVRNLITILVDMVARASRLNPKIEAAKIYSIPGIVLIDEIDLHLHPIWQRAAVNILLSTFPYVQFIVTTHSPFVLKELPPGSVVNLDGHRGTNEGSIEDIAEGVLGVTVPQRSLRQHRLVQAARAYFSAMHTASEDQLRELRRVFDEAMAPFANDSAAIALLKLEELAARGRRQ